MFRYICHLPHHRRHAAEVADVARTSAASRISMPSNIGRPLVNVGGKPSHATPCTSTALSSPAKPSSSNSRAVRGLGRGHAPRANTPQPVRARDRIWAVIVQARTVTALCSEVLWTNCRRNGLPNRHTMIIVVTEVLQGEGMCARRFHFVFAYV